MSLPIVGIPYKNQDGSNRQFEVLLCDRGEPVELRREPKNKYDEHAIAIWSCRGVQMGYIPSQRAPYLGALMRAGHDLFAVFQQALPTGAVIRIGIGAPPSLPAIVQEAVSPSLDGVDPDDGYYPDYLPPDD